MQQDPRKYASTVLDSLLPAGIVNVTSKLYWPAMDEFDACHNATPREWAWNLGCLGRYI